MTYRKYCSTGSFAVDYTIGFTDEKASIRAELIEGFDIPENGSDEVLVSTETYIYSSINQRNAAIATICTKANSEQMLKRFLMKKELPPPSV